MQKFTVVGGFRLANDNVNEDPSCRLCDASCEDIKHILTECRATSDITSRLLPELLNILVSISPNSHIPKAPVTDHKNLDTIHLGLWIF